MTNRWNEKRYHSLDYHLKEVFNEKIYKIALSSSNTCPNRDGKIDTRGCIFCSQGGSGDFAQPKTLPVSVQIEKGKELVSKKYSGSRYIAYFQAYTGTYAPLGELRTKFYEAANNPEIAVLSIATRPDCLSDEVIDLLGELSKIKPLWIELGLQTMHEETARFIRRGYELSCFETAVAKLNSIHAKIIVHVIAGLPKESPNDFLETINYLSHVPVHGIKIQLLHILEYTDMAKLYYSGEYIPLSLDEYTDLVINALELLPPRMVIHRLTGDGKKDLLIAPTWSLNKKNVLNTINSKLKINNTWQGRLFVE